MSTTTKRLPRASEPSGDPRTRRSRRWLQDALLELLQEQPLAAIQITELCERAGVSRPTFYLHFGSKEELLVSLLDRVFDGFYSQLAVVPEAVKLDLQDLSILLFQTWEREADTLRLILQADRSGPLIQRLKEHFIAIYHDLAAAPRQPAVDARLRELVVAFAAGGAYMLLAEWLAQDRPFNGEQMGQLLYTLTNQTERAITATTERQVRPATDRLRHW